jgi:hypothetical protein
VQIITIADLFSGREPNLPRPMADEVFTRIARPTRQRRRLPSAQLPLILPLPGGKAGAISEAIEDHFAGRIIPKMARRINSPETASA